MQIRVYSQSKKEILKKEYAELGEMGQILPEKTFWIDIEGFDSESLKEFGEKYNFDSLTLEDISTGRQRIKIEEYNNYIFAVCKGVSPSKGSQFDYMVDEVYLLIQQNLIFTLHRMESSTVRNTLETLKNRVSVLRKETPLPSLVFHMIFDFSVDSFYSALANVENWLISMRDDALDIDRMKTTALVDVKKLMFTISRSKRELSEFRVMLTQHRDIMALAERGALKFVSVDLMSDFRDVYDHTFQLIETLDSYMLRTSDVRDMYFTLRAAFTDNILRLLTIVATIFLPLTFLTGFYGMNFTAGFFQPGTANIYGFYMLIAGMVSLASIMLYFFRRRGWI